MLLRIQAENHNNTTCLYYHSACQTSYYGKLSNKRTKAKINIQQTICDIHKEAREKLFKYVEEEIIKKKSFFFDTLETLFNNIFRRITRNCRIRV